jgi:hypothetical protein
LGQRDQIVLTARDFGQKRVCKLGHGESLGGRRAYLNGGNHNNRFSPKTKAKTLLRVFKSR